MNANTVINSCDEMGIERGNTSEPMQRKQARLEPRRERHVGSAGGGMHGCSVKSPNWGTGAGARLADLRAFAGAVALVAFALLSPASAETFTWQQVGSAGNAANIGGNGLGAVANNFKISAFDTTISQYVDFLNGSYAGKYDKYGVWNASIGTGGSTSVSAITRTGSAGTYAYTLSGTNFANKPVNFVNWFSAARFVNWHSNGMDATSTTATETGSYTLDGKTTGDIVARNANATIYLPSADEWSKAAFYNSDTQSYYLWGTSSNERPTAVLPTGNTPVTVENSANWRDNRLANDVRMTDVGTYVKTKSPYGLFDMFGNVTQMTDTSGTGANAGLFQAFGGSYATTTAQSSFWNSAYKPGVFRAGAPDPTVGVGTAAIGFRVAAFVVPEPGNMVAAAIGIGGLIGFQIMKRRKLALARAAG